MLHLINGGEALMTNLHLEHQMPCQVNTVAAAAAAAAAFSSSSLLLCLCVCASMSVYAEQLAGLREYCSSKESAGFVLQAETWLQMHLQQQGIAVHPVPMPAYILRASGEHSLT